MSSALEILLVVLVVALFFSAGRLAGPMRGLGRMVGRFTRVPEAPAAEAERRHPPMAALPRPPAVG